MSNVKFNMRLNRIVPMTSTKYQQQNIEIFNCNLILNPS